METLHEDEDPSLWISACLLESFHGRHICIAHRHIIANHARVCKFSLFLCQPTSCLGCIWEEPESEDSDDKGNNSFEHEEPKVC